MYISIPIVKAEVVDTYGGNFTYRDVWLESNSNPDAAGTYSFVEEFYGALPGRKMPVSSGFEIDALTAELTPELIAKYNLPEDIKSRIK
jgi:hypothetical protein